jgi:hypothetical protein
MGAEAGGRTPGKHLTQRKQRLRPTKEDHNKEDKTLSAENYHFYFLPLHNVHARR